MKINISFIKTWGYNTYDTKKKHILMYQMYYIYGKDIKMKYLKQFLVILVIAFAGEVLKYIIPLPIPASIYGLIILFVGLLTGLIRLEQVREAGKFLIEIMPVMFIPAAVGLLESWGVLQPMFLPVIIITLVSTVVVMAATGISSQLIIRLGKNRNK